MNRWDLAKQLRAHNCQVARPGGKHEIWEHTASGRTVAVPRHNIVKRSTIRWIGDDLETPRPS